MKHFFLFIMLFSIFPACADDARRRLELNEQYQALDYSFKTPMIILDPFERTPLTALLRFKTSQPARITLTVAGRDNAKELTHTFQDKKSEHEIPVLGLYPDHNNRVTLTAEYDDGSSEKSEIQIRTHKVPKRALFVTEQKNDHETRYHFLHDGIVFDEDGWMRFSFKNDGQIVYWFNGNLIAEDRNSGLTRYSMSGEFLQHYPFPKDFVSFAHGIAQKPNGNFLVIGSFSGKKAVIANEEQPTQREFVIELDYKTGKHLNTIDLANILNPDRSVIIKSATRDYGLNDWCHINSVDYDSSDKSIVVSCRHVGIIKVDETTHQLTWVVSMHQGFDKSGRNGTGPNLREKLLTALDKNGKILPISVQKGVTASTDFKWPAKTHHAKVLGNNLFSVFDNAGSLYDTNIITTPTSNASVYKIDPDQKTIQRIWSHSLPWISESASSVLYRPDLNEVIVYASTVKDKNQTGISYGKLIRYDLTTHKPLFEATVYRGGETYFYRVDDFMFYVNK